MGQWFSSSRDSVCSKNSYFSLKTEEETGDISNTPSNSKKLLDIDPRSPTADIHRTPIEVNSTPKPRRSGFDENMSPVSGLTGNRQRSLHQRIIDKRRTAAEES
uniref:Uncharacterized protein n=1 Tax=Heterorhabditis bacteriophora TaxID=37862 RepID=A0A1I7XBG4_HETBA